MHVVPALAGSAAAPVLPVAPVVPRVVPDVPRVVPDVPGPAPVVARVVPAAAPAVPVLGSVEVAAPETSPAAAPSVPVDDWVLVNPESSGVAAAESAVVATEAPTNGSETAAANGSEAAPHGSEAAATEPEICCICQDAMIVHRQTLTPIFCGHVFHASCLGEWRFCARKTHLQCPYRCEHSMCLDPIIPAQNFVGFRKFERHLPLCFMMILLASLRLTIRNLNEIQIPAADDSGPGLVAVDASSAPPSDVGIAAAAEEVANAF